MKERTFIAISSIATTCIGMLITLAETCLLVHFGADRDTAFITSLYTGFLGWIILAAVLATTDWFYDHIISKIIDE